MSSLVAIDTVSNGSTSNAEVKLTGIDDSFERYVLIGTNIGSNYNTQMNIQVTKSGTAHTSSDYECVGYNLRSDTTSILNRATTSSTQFQIWNNMTGGNLYNQETAFFYLYLTNFADATKYDYMYLSGVAESNGQQGYYAPLNACVVKNASASDGILLRENSGQLYTGEMTLYGIK
jgi:hypothetical protein